MKFRIVLSLLTLCPFLANTLAAQQSDTQRDEHVEATLVGEWTHAQPGTPYRVGLLLKHDPGWHTYWKSTATGYATSINWDLPPGWKASKISWPVPKVYDFQGLTDYVYDGEVLLMVTLTPPQTVETDAVQIGFTAEWLMCENVCIPGSITNSISIPVSRDSPKPSQWKERFDLADSRLPADPGSYQLSAWRTGTGVQLAVEGPQPEGAYFFDSQAVFKALPEMSITRPDNRHMRINLELDPATNEPPSRLVGVLKADPGWPGLAGGPPGIRVDIPIDPVPPAPDTRNSGLSMGLLLLAFGGGLILNLMPCVFPVLGIKIMGFMGQAGSSRAKVISHGLSFTAGVLISFWILAGLLLILRSGGSQLGWGFQLQSPGFVLALTLLLFAFGLNMSGLFEVGQSAVGVGANLTSRSGLAGSFFSGILATVVATPCAAPFLAPALGAALTLPPVTSVLVFTCIALGLSMPYLLLSAFPSLIDRLPRPGAWMETFKQVMGFLLYASVAFLLWVLAGQLAPETGYSAFAFLKVLLSLVLTALALWIYGRWGAFGRKRGVRAAGIAVSALVLAGALTTGFTGTDKPDVEGPEVKWVEWEPGKAEALSAEGKIVYVDFTARWCVTCQTNKAAVFSSPKVRRTFKELGVVPLKADWTNQDPRISQALQSYGRSAVPFNLVYGPGFSKPRILPELLTPGIVLDALESARSESNN